MKKIILLLLVAVTLSQCGNHHSFIKRRYNKGFYIASSKKSENAKPKQIATPKKQTNVQVVKVTSSVIEPMHIVLEENNNTVLVKNDDIKPSNHVLSIIKPKNSNSTNTDNNNNLSAQAKGKTLVKQKSSQKSLMNALLLNKLLYKGKKADDTNTLILVILSLFPFICLIAVYLKDGKRITLNFWIDLLLHLTFIGEIIFALLVVLDIINLA